ncbi:MAG: hypothetical protein M3N43_04125 [Actinomycetota bacterium]|nr:hypothetical protein [Actinomycetota bacterium]
MVIRSDLVVILLDFDDETWQVTEPMWRWEANYRCWEFATGKPYADKRVTRALLIPRELYVH